MKKIILILLCILLWGVFSPLTLTAQITSYSCTGRTDLTIEFDVPGDTGINLIILTFNTNTTHTSTPLFRLTTPGSATPIYINIDNSGDPTLDLGPNPTSGKLIYLTEPATGNYELVVVEKPEDHPRGEVGAGGYYGGDEHWTFTVTGMDMCDISGTIESWSNDIIPVQLFEIPGGDYDIANLTANPCPASNTPPTACFTATAGTEPTTISFDGNCSSETDPGDSITLYTWDFDIHDADPPVSTALPTTTHDYIDHGVYTASLVVTDTHSAVSTAYEFNVLVYPDQTIVFPPHINVAGSGVYLTPPVMDGEIQEDTGWNESMKITHEGGADAELTFQGLKDRSTALADGYLYLAFQVRNDSEFHEDSVVLIGLSADDSTATPADDRILAIYPFAVGHTPGVNLDPDHVRIWDGGVWADLSAAQMTTMNMQIKIRSAVPGYTDAWDIEIRIPTNTTSGGAGWITLNDNFLFYYNVIRTQTVPEPLAVQYRWPYNGAQVDGDLELYAFDRRWWSHADKTTGATCNGVWVDKYDIGIQDNPGDPIGSSIKLPTALVDPAVNRFVARVQNNWEKEILAAPFLERIDANGVYVQFRIANWGIPALGDWSDVPSVPNPTSPPQTVLGGTAGGAPGEYTFESIWSIALTDPNLTDYQAHTHQCVQAIIFSNQNAKIVRSSVYRNMNFVDASEFKRKAVISVRGLGKPPSRWKKHKYVIYVSQREWVIRRDPDKRINQKDIIENTRPKGTGDEEGAAGEAGEDIIVDEDTDSYLVWAAYGYRYNGKAVIIKGNPYYLADSMGSFGYVVHHEGEVMQWETDIEGAEKADEHNYTIEIDPETVVEVLTRIKPVEFSGFAVSIHAGASLPVGNLANDYTIGFNVIADVSYQITPDISIIAMLGYNYFPAVNSSDDGTSIINITLNGRYTIPISGDFKAYAGAGPDIYVQDFTTLLYGFNVGAGVDYVIDPRIVLEAGVEYHSTFDMQTMFLQGHVGAFIRF
ncbi:MAG: outer membrane beta-barrel protein [Spirochaetales bacterium]|nr:outer membrane beta-barrel protein [Spirochaetales bacterium]